MNTKIYVGNLSYSILNENLEEMFSQFGKVESARVVTDRDTNRSKGFGFVEMSNSHESTRAIEELNGKDFGGRQINVSEANTTERKRNF